MFPSAITRCHQKHKSLHLQTSVGLKVMQTNVEFLIQTYVSSFFAKKCKVENQSCIAFTKHNLHLKNKVGIFFEKYRLFFHIIQNRLTQCPLPKFSSLKRACNGAKVDESCSNDASNQKRTRLKPQFVPSLTWSDRNANCVMNIKDA